MSKPAWCPALAAFVMLAFGAGGGRAEPTEVVVRVLAKDAKFVASSVGGAQVTIRDADTGELLASGLKEGDTGDTQRLMKKDWKRGVPLSTEGAAKFSAILVLEEPRRIEVTAEGPMAQPRSANRVSATQWIVPGKSLNQGDAFLLVLPGLTVDAGAPLPDLPWEGAALTVPLTAQVAMMCGCPVEPGGTWDANGFQVAVRVRRDGQPLPEVKLTPAGTSQFAGELRVEAPGLYELTMYAHDPSTGNTGVDRLSLAVGP